jgi:hypothetical protein
MKTILILFLSVLFMQSTQAQKMHIKDSAGALILMHNDQPILQYNYKADAVYQRTGYIHPVWAPNGDILTNINPPDHLHHYGIWNPFTHTRFEGRETDFWNLQKKEGTVRFVKLLNKLSTDQWCSFKAAQDHIAIDKEGHEKVALHEILDVRAYDNGTWDFVSTLTCASDSPLELLQYRYGGGFGFRAAAAWNAENTSILTSEGKTRDNSDSTRARWIKMKGPHSGLVVMCAAKNHDYPQLLRVWPSDSEKGQLMMNYSPTKSTSWTLEPGKWYVQQYRVIVFTGDISVAEIEKAWQLFLTDRTEAGNRKIKPHKTH